MVTNSELRQALRPNGIRCPGCDNCQFREPCGGLHNGALFGNCFEELCCHFNGKDKSTCNAVCPYKKDFDGWITDTRGLIFSDLPPIEQSEISLPLYIPLIDHAASRSQYLEWPVVALNTYSVLGRRRKGSDRGSDEGPGDLRADYRLAGTTKIVLRGVATDPELERYWENRVTSDLPGRLSRLGIDSAIGPNFSHYLDVPRTDHLYNKRRQLICLAELAAAGVPVVPHLNSVMPGDWVFWRRYLEMNPSLNVVAIEFQTGNKNPLQGRKVLDQLASIQLQLKKPLHLTLVGGSQFLEYAAVRFAQITLIDSTPFHKSMRRYEFDGSQPRHHWQERYMLIGDKLDWLLAKNIAEYSKWLEQRIQSARQVGERN